MIKKSKLFCPKINASASVGKSMFKTLCFNKVSALFSVWLLSLSMLSSVAKNCMYGLLLLSISPQRRNGLWLKGFLFAFFLLAESEIFA